LRLKGSKSSLLALPRSVSEKHYDDRSRGFDLGSILRSSIQTLPLIRGNGKILFADQGNALGRALLDAGTTFDTVFRRGYLH